jgi:hypothetical protein
VARVSGEGENLLDHGFYASVLEEERSIPDYYVDQLMAAEDVSDEVFAATDTAASEEARRRVRQEAFRRIRERIRSRHQVEDGEVRVEITALYNGGRYSAYTYRRLRDVRLVAAAELQLGFFGGDPDNFTYPRYALDFAFLRVYGNDGEPLETEHFFTWSEEGVEEGDVIFVIGNPGPTNRLNTVAQLEFQRDISVPAQKAFLSSRLDAMRSWYAENRERGEELGLRNRMFGLSNSLKASTGRLDALTDPAIMARKARGEEVFQDSLMQDPALRERFGDLISDMAAIQDEKEVLGPEYSAYVGLGSTTTESGFLLRSLSAAMYLNARRMDLPEDTVAAMEERLLAVENHPLELEEALLAERLRDFQRYLGPDHPVTEAALAGRSVEGAVSQILRVSVLSSQEEARDALADDVLPADDPGLLLAEAILSSYGSFQNRYSSLLRQEEELAAQLGRARFQVYGTDVPPDASRSPRITDGVVRPYEYNGTKAPVYTTFFGLYDHYFSYGEASDWNLPDRWLPPPEALNLTTPLNFISTADTYGGNSGSPAVTPGLSIVGLNFDRNIEGLSRDFIYLPDRGRNIMVDVRAIREAMDVVYDADRIVQEFLTHELFRTESEADAAAGGSEGGKEPR